MIDLAMLDRLEATEWAYARYGAYVRGTLPCYVDGWLPRDLCRRLQHFSEDVRARRGPRLMLTIAPRHGKTMHAGERLIPFHLGHAPHDEVIVACHGAALASDISTTARNLIRDDTFTRSVFPELALSKDTATKVNWKTTAGGGCRAAGVGGPIVGRGADMFIVDDPIKLPKDALSEATREGHWQWWGGAARTRISPGGGALVIMTRWHKDDLAGRLEERAAHEGWDIVRYPVIAEEDERGLDGRLIRAAGDALHPERWPLEELEKIKRGIPPIWWRAQYLGQPSDPGGGIFERALWRHWTVGPPTLEQAALGWRQHPTRFDEVVISADLTFGSQSDSASYVSLQAYGLKDGVAYLLEEERGRWKYPEQRNRLRAMAKRWHARRVLVEKAAHGAAVLQELELEVRGLEAVRPDGSKEVRAHAAYPAVADARLLLPDPSVHAWVRRLINELCDFPFGKNDDSVDALVQFVRAVLVAPPRRRLVVGGRVCR